MAAARNPKVIRLKHFTLAYGLNIFKGLSDEARLRIMWLLHKNQALCSSDLELVLDFTQTKCSRHLSYLKNCGLIQAKREEQWVFFSINPELEEYFANQFSYLEKDAQLQADQDIYNTLFSNRELAVNKLAQKIYRSTPL